MSPTNDSNRTSQIHNAIKSKISQLDSIEPNSNFDLEQEQLERKEREYAERIASISSSVSSKEEWQTKLVEKYNKLYDIFHTKGCNLGDKNNEQVRFFYIWWDRGYIHQAIDFQEIPGRLREDGTPEIADWILKNYYNVRPHEHKQGRAVKVD
jgi:hypothetical protein